MNKKSATKYLIVGLISNVFYYFIFSDLIITTVLSVLTSFIFAKYILEYLNEVKIKVAKIQFSHQFINSLIIQLSVNPSLYDSIQQIKDYLPDEYKYLFEETEENHIQILSNLANVLEIPIFNIFVKIMSLYESQGGDPLIMSYNLINDLDNLKVKTDAFIKSKRRKLRDFNLIWIMIGFILLYIRFFLNNYYESILTPSFKLILGINAIIFIASQFMFAQKYRNINLEGGMSK